MSSEVGLLPSLIQKHHPTRGAGVILRRLCCLGVAVALAVLISPGVRSELASRQEMDNVARNWLTETVSRTGHWAGTGDPVITGSREIQLDGTAIGRCYDVSPRGFVLVPALRSLNPVKAYSDESSLSLDDTGGLAKLLTDVLIGYSTTFRDAFGRLSAVPPAGMAGDDQILRQRWHSLGVDPREYTGSAAAQGLSQGGPLLTSSWHQRAPYDYFCPMGDGQRTAAGCVPISLAQILRYWEWPPSGTGDKTYLWPGDYSCGGSTSETELWADFSDPYDWTNMPDSCDDANGCSPAEEAAVAELCFEAGMALGTNYGACGSSAPANFAVLPETFRYATSLKSRLRTDHTRQEWFDRVQLEVNAGRPAWYIVYAHAVVCDGWREQPDGQLEYHMNYGWGQAANAWYVLDTLYCSWMPGDLCPYEYEWMVTGIEPGVAPELECTGYALDDASGNGNGCAEKGEQVGLTITIRNYGEEALNVTGSISTDDIWLSINTPSALFGPSTTHWGTSTAQTPMEIEIAPNCPDPHVALLELTLSADGGYTHLDSLFLFVGEQTGFADDLEGGFQYWSHHSARPFFGNQWHLETYRSHSGASSWKAGGSGASGYDNNLGADLLTPPFLLPPDGQLSFWHCFYLCAGRLLGTTGSLRRLPVSFILELSQCGARQRRSRFLCRH